MLTNVQQDVHIKYYSNWGRLEMLFIKPPFEIAMGPTLKTPEKLSIKKYLANAFSENRRDLSTA
jgi:hypothetical protein